MTDKRNMSPKTEVATQAKSTLPELYRPAPLEIGSDDISLPKLYVAQAVSTAFTEGYVTKLGVLYSATGPDDDEPEVLYDPAEGGEGVLAHVLGLRLGYSMPAATSPTGEFETWAYNDPDVPKDADKTYGYTLALPEVDADIPYRITLSRSGSPTARKINTVIKRVEGQMPAYALAFRLTTEKKSNGKNTWHIVKATTVEAKPEHVEAASRLAEMVASVPAVEQPAKTTSEPAI